MARSGVRRSPLSLWSSVLMMLLGMATILFVSYLLGSILVTLGFVMYLVYRKLNKPPLAPQ